MPCKIGHESLKREILRGAEKQGIPNNLKGRETLGILKADGGTWSDFENMTKDRAHWEAFVCDFCSRGRAAGIDGRIVLMVDLVACGPAIYLNNRSTGFCVH